MNSLNITSLASPPRYMYTHRCDTTPHLSSSSHDADHDGMCLHACIIHHHHHSSCGARAGPSAPSPSPPIVACMDHVCDKKDFLATYTIAYSCHLHLNVLWMVSLHSKSVVCTCMVCPVSHRRVACFIVIEPWVLTCRTTDACTSSNRVSARLPNDLLTLSMVIISSVTSVVAWAFAMLITWSSFITVYVSNARAWSRRHPRCLRQVSILSSSLSSVARSSPTLMSSVALVNAGSSAYCLHHRRRLHPHWLSPNRHHRPHQVHHQHHSHQHQHHHHHHHHGHGHHHHLSVFLRILMTWVQLKSACEFNIWMMKWTKLSQIAAALVIISIVITRYQR